jgi:hypothetical protein
MGLRNINGVREPDIDTSTGTSLPTARLEPPSGNFNINRTTLYEWDSAPLIDNTVFDYESGEDYITVLEDATYEVQLNIGFIIDENVDRPSPNAFLYKNRTSSGSGGTQLSTAAKTGYIRNTDGHEESSLHLSWAGDLEEDVSISVQMKDEANFSDCEDISDETNMYVKQIA